MKAEPICDLQLKLGPVVAQECRQVTPSAMMCSQVLLEHLLRNGCESAVVQPKKLRYALHKYLHSNRVMVGKWGCEAAVDAVSCHWQQCFAMLRALKREEIAGRQWRRYPKTGGFRKAMMQKDWPTIWHLMGLVCLEAQSPGPGGRMAEHPNDENDCGGEVAFRRGPEKQEEPAMIDGFPAIFLTPQKQVEEEPDLLSAALSWGALDAFLQLSGQV